MADEQNTTPLGQAPGEASWAAAAPEPAAPATDAAAEAAAAPEPPTAPEPPEPANVTYYNANTASDPTIAVDPAPTATYPAQGTAPMPNPYPDPQPTAPIPEAQPVATPIPPAPQPAPGAYQGAVQHQPMAPEPAYTPVAPLSQLTGGMKFGWLVVGMLAGIPGMIIAWLVNVDKHPQVKKDAIMWSVIGFAINIVIGIIFAIAFTGLIAAAISSGATGSYYGGGYYF